MLKNISVLLVDDHTLIRTALKALLDTEKDISVVGEASDGETALRLVREIKPQVVLMDISMPGMGGQEAMRRIVRAYPKVRVIMVTSYREEPKVLLKTGAAGFLPKDCLPEQLITAIRRVCNGFRYIAPAIAQDIALSEIKQKNESPSSPVEELSVREKQILKLLSSGLTVKQIAKKFSVTSKTINTYRYRLYDKLDAVNDVELAHIAILHKLVDISKIDLKNKE